MIIQMSVEITGEEEQAYQALAPAEQSAYAIAKLAGGMSSHLLKALGGRTNVLAILPGPDAASVGSLIAAIKAMP